MQDGKVAGKGRVKGCLDMPEGAELVVANWEVEIDSPIEESAFRSTYLLRVVLCLTLVRHFSNWEVEIDSRIEESAFRSTYLLKVVLCLTTLVMFSRHQVCMYDDMRETPPHFLSLCLHFNLMVEL